MNATPLLNEAAPEFVDSTPILKAALSVSVAGLKRSSAERRIAEESISKIPRIQEKVKIFKIRQKRNIHVKLE